MVLFDIGYYFELAFQWFESKLMSPFIHILLSLLLFISFSFLFQTLTLNSFSFSYYQSTILMSICIINFIVVAILMCLVVCWTWIDNSIQNKHRFNPSIIHSWDKNNSKWWMKEWLFVYNILVAEYQFVSYDNLIIVIDYIIWASFIHSCIDWFFDLHSKSVDRSVSVSIVIETNSKWLNDWMIDLLVADSYLIGFEKG